MSPAKKRKPPSMFTIVIIGIVLLGVAAIIATRSSERPAEDQATATVGIDGDPLPALPADDGEDPAIGKVPPVLAGTSLTGERLTIDPTEPMAVLFLAHWCPHCQAEVRDLVAWLEDNELPSDVRLVAVSTLVERTRGNYPPEAWLEGEQWPFETLEDDAASSAADSWGLRGTPYWVFLDADGRVAGRASGVLGPQELAARMEDLREPAGEDG